MLAIRPSGGHTDDERQPECARRRAHAGSDTDRPRRRGRVHLGLRRPGARQGDTAPQGCYNWTINGKLYDPPNDGIEVKPGQRVRIRFINESKMFHPMHFHGHTAQVMLPMGGPGGSGLTPAARKDTVLVAPLATVAMDFDTDNPGKWINHCHNTYHLEAGMATFLFYS